MALLSRSYTLVKNSMKLCAYGCGQRAKFLHISGKWCCNKFYTTCPEVIRKKIKTRVGKKDKPHNKPIKVDNSNRLYRLCNYGCKKKARFYFPIVNKWCCSEYYQSCPNIKKEYSIKMSGNGNPMFGKPGTWLGKKNPDQSKRMKKNNPGKNKTEETKRKMSESKKGTKNHFFGKNRPEHSKLIKSLWSDLEFIEKQRKSRSIKPNKLELFFESWLNKNFPNEWKYVGNFKFWIGGKNPDFVSINNKKNLIELFGNYWHKNDSPKKRINHFKKYGFNTLILWEKEIKNMEKVKNKIIKEFYYEK
mgnify:CR=1 FL=1